jgi:hypothetical protein
MVSDAALSLACKDARIAELEAALAAAQADISARDILIDTLRVLSMGLEVSSEVGA